MFKKRIHVLPSADGRGYTTKEWRGYRAVWESWRRWGWGVAWHNLRFLLTRRYGRVQRGLSRVCLIRSVYGRIGASCGRLWSALGRDPGDGQEARHD